jgi:flagellar assembly factor FliW
MGAAKRGFGMNCSNSTAIEPAAELEVRSVKLPMGLLGFEQMKDYLLVFNPVEEPFRWLQVKDDPALAFVVIDPFLVKTDYHPDIPQPDVEFLGLAGPDDAVLYNIVTLHGEGRATVNLKGPVVVNRHTRIGKQVVVANAGQYSVDHPLPLAEGAVA